MGNFRKNKDRSFGKDRDRGDRGSRGERSFGGRDGRKSSGGFGKRSEMHDEVCAKCGKACQVPFKPNMNKPVLCSDCFRNQGSTHESFSPRERSYSSGQSSGQAGISQEQFRELNLKLDKILKVLENIEIEEEEDDDEEGEE